jgi:tRNA isopentenyl-2-thiomethyl-A-37 hydroxylase MiaE
MVNWARAVCAPARQCKSAARQRRARLEAPARAKTRKNVRALSRFFLSKVIVAAFVPNRPHTRGAKAVTYTPLLLLLFVVALLAAEP